jgi:YD repeat-containing protein
MLRSVPDLNGSSVCGGSLPNGRLILAFWNDMVGEELHLRFTLQHAHGRRAPGRRWPVGGYRHPRDYHHAGLCPQHRQRRGRERAAHEDLRREQQPDHDIVLLQPGLYPCDVTNAQQQVTHAEFDLQWGKPHSVTDVNSNITSYTYDGLGRLLSITKPLDVLNGIPYAWRMYAYQFGAPGSPPAPSQTDTFVREIYAPGSYVQSIAF